MLAKRRRKTPKIDFTSPTIRCLIRTTRHVPSHRSISRNFLKIYIYHRPHQVRTEIFTVRASSPLSRRRQLTASLVRLAYAFPSNNSNNSFEIHIYHRCYQVRIKSFIVRAPLPLSRNRRPTPPPSCIDLVSPPQDSTPRLKFYYFYISSEPCLKILKKHVRGR
jgi:hypothetical protein